MTHQIDKNDDDRVRREFACPQCGEDRLDELVWIGDDCQEVRCNACGTIYSPGDDPQPHVTGG
jgi:uncharacterized Zn finger protein